MQSKSLKAAVMTAVLASAVTLPVIAEAQGKRDGRGAHQHADRQRGDGGRMRAIMALYDTNEDGTLTQQEIDTARAERLAAFDSDNNGQLDLSEYEALWLDASRERMVDRFQSHDANGDGQITGAEFGAQLADLVVRGDHNGDGVLDADDRRAGRGTAAPSE